ncbi:MFS transporter [Streptomyces varsoviensis]|uniref:MFS transporter n=1 Tax=Streptomyces varsoviensis TaxID=67373 RepID=UPI0004C6F2A2|nr:MFS transporter [Streptomyces varsoviensis]
MTDALAAPTRDVGRGWTAALSLANGAVWAGWFGPIQVLLALQAAEVAPGHKAAALAWVTGAGAAVSVVANPLFGALSDRTASRYGRRTPWIAAGALGGAAGLGVLAAADTLAVMITGWCLVQLALNAAFAALTAAVPDRVPRRQRGTVGGRLGAAQILGVLAGTGLATAAGGGPAGYLACAACAVLGVLPYLLLHRDLVLPRALRPPFGARAFAAGFLISPRAHPDLAWAWLTRFLINLGNSIALLYLLYYLRDVVRYPGDAEDGVLILTAVNSAALLATVVAAGAHSDRTGRRKPYVTGAGVLIAGSAALLACWPAWPGTLTAAALLGVGYGVFTSVDFALITDVLPAAADRGRDLGVVNIANSLPQVLAPALAAPVVTRLGGYPVLYSLAGALVLAGAAGVHRIRGVV